MDKALWKMFQKDLGWDDEKMTYFYGEPGAPVDYSDIDDFFNGGGQLEGYTPYYMRIMETNKETAKVVVGPEIEKWLYSESPRGDHIRGKCNEWIIPIQTLTLMKLKFDGHS